jgi:hypothetical protein
MFLSERRTCFGLCRSCVVKSGSVVEVVYVGVLNQSFLVIHVDSGTEFVPLRVITTEPGIGIRTLRPQRH